MMQGAKGLSSCRVFAAIKHIGKFKFSNRCNFGGEIGQSKSVNFSENFRIATIFCTSFW